MPLSVLLAQNPVQNHTFSFEHAMSHRRLLANLSPLGRFSVIPYHVDPGRNNTHWHLDHGQSHDDFQMNLPGWYGPGTFDILNPAYNIIDTDLMSESQRKWWTFQNHQEHLVAENINSLTEVWIFPFW